MQKLVKTLRLECLWNDWTLKTGDPTFEGNVLFYDNNYVIGVVKDINNDQRKLIIGCVVDGCGINLTKFDPSGVEVPRIYNIGTFAEHYGGEFHTVDALGCHSYGLADLYLDDNELSQDEMKNLFAEIKECIEEIQQKNVPYVSLLLEQYINGDYEAISKQIIEEFSDENSVSDEQAEVNAMEFISKLLGKSFITDEISKGIETLKKEKREMTYDNLKETIAQSIQNNPSSKYTQEELEKLLSDLSDILHEVFSPKEEKSKDPTCSDVRVK